MLKIVLPVAAYAGLPFNINGAPTATATVAVKVLLMNFLLLLFSMVMFL